MARQSWRRVLIVLLLLLAVAFIVVPLLGADPPPLRVALLNAAPYLFIVGLWTAVFWGLPRPVMIFVVLGTMALAAFATVAAADAGASVPGIIMSLLPYLFILALFATLPYLRARAFRKNPLAQGDVTLELTPDELRIMRQDHTAGLRWSGILRATETPAFFLFYYTKACAYYLPKRAIPPADLPDIRTFLRAHVLSGLL